MMTIMTIIRRRRTIDARFTAESTRLSGARDALGLPSLQGSRDFAADYLHACGADRTFFANDELIVAVMVVVLFADVNTRLAPIKDELEVRSRVIGLLTKNGNGKRNCRGRAGVARRVERAGGRRSRARNARRCDSSIALSFVRVALLTLRSEFPTSIPKIPAMVKFATCARTITATPWAAVVPRNIRKALEALLEQVRCVVSV